MKTLFRTGKLTPRQDARTLRLAQFLDTAALPTPPATLTYASRVSPWPMYGNDTLGDCTCAAAGHMIELWAKLEGQTATPARRTIVNAYRKLSPDDQGCVMLDVLRFWRNSGFASHKLFAFAALDLKNRDHVMLGVSMFGGVYLGVNLPQSAQEQTGPGKAWDVPAGGLHGNGAPGSWGGHAINVVGYDSTGLDVITWGMVQRVSWAFWSAYGDEAWAALSLDWQKAPKISGIDFAALNAALAKIGKRAA
jgi:hypothetical protein